MRCLSSALKARLAPEQRAVPWLGVSMTSTRDIVKSKLERGAPKCAWIHSMSMGHSPSFNGINVCSEVSHRLLRTDVQIMHTKPTKPSKVRWAMIQKLKMHCSTVRVKTIVPTDLFVDPITSAPRRSSLHAPILQGPRRTTIRDRNHAHTRCR